MKGVFNDKLLFDLSNNYIATPLTMSNIRWNALGGTRRDVTMLRGWRPKISYCSEFGFAAAECLSKCMFTSSIMWVYFMVLNRQLPLQITQWVVYIYTLLDTTSGSKKPRVTKAAITHVESQHPLVGCHLYYYRHWMIWEFSCCIFWPYSGNITIFFIFPFALIWTFVHLFFFIQVCTVNCAWCLYGLCLITHVYLYFV